jgi:hypothetical protein
VRDLVRREAGTVQTRRRRLLLFEEGLAVAPRVLRLGEQPERREELHFGQRGRGEAMRQQHREASEHEPQAARDGPRDELHNMVQEPHEHRAATNRIPTTYLACRAVKISVTRPQTLMSDRTR